MTTDQQFCLRWNNFHTNITSAFESLRDDEDFVDITLACEGRQIKAHKMVLSACSPYFRNLLRGNPCQHPIVFLKDVTFANLTSILDFMYHGEVNVSHNELATFLKTAEALRVRGLAEDEKKRDRDTCTKSSSPPPPRDLPEPCSPGRPDEPLGEGGGRVSAGPPENSSHSDGPPMKRQRRQSGGTSGTTAGSTAAISPRSSTEQQHSTPTPANTSTDLTTQQQLDNVRDCVKNEPEDYINEDEEILGPQSQQQTQQQLASEDIKLDGFSGSQDDSTSDYMGNESVSISSRSQAAMQQLQETFSSFIPGMSSQNPGGSFMPHSTAGGDHGRGHPPFSLEGVVQGLPPGISALPGPSMSQSGGASQDSSGQGVAVAAPIFPPPHTEPDWMIGNCTVTDASDGRPPCRAPVSCLFCGRVCSNKYILKTHIDDKHSGDVQRRHICPHCSREYASRNSLHSHVSRYHKDREVGHVPLPTVKLLEDVQPAGHVKNTTGMLPPNSASCTELSTRSSGSASSLLSSLPASISVSSTISGEFNNENIMGSSSVMDSSSFPYSMQQSHPTSHAYSTNQSSVAVSHGTPGISTVVETPQMAQNSSLYCQTPKSNLSSTEPRYASHYGNSSYQETVSAMPPDVSVSAVPFLPNIDSGSGVSEPVTATTPPEQRMLDAALPSQTQTK